MVTTKQMLKGPEESESKSEEERRKATPSPRVRRIIKEVCFACCAV